MRFLPTAAQAGFRLLLPVRFAIMGRERRTGRRVRLTGIKQRRAVYSMVDPKRIFWNPDEGFCGDFIPMSLDGFYHLL